MKRYTTTVMLILAICFTSASCSFSNRDALTEAARAEFHRRWAAKQFHEIYVNSVQGETHPEFENDFVSNWARSRRDYGNFVKDTQDYGTHGFEASQSGYGPGYSAQNERYHNTEYSGTKMPIVEEFKWGFKDDGTVRLGGFNVQPNAEVRCSYRLTASSNVCEVTKLGPVPSTKPL